MGIVIGPLEKSPKQRFASWFLMRELKESIKYMKATDPINYRGAIDKENDIYKETFKEYTISIH